MPRHGHRGVTMDGLMMPTKTRKRGCSSSSSTSSKVQHYRLNKRAILVGKSRAGLSIGYGSRSTTPVPTWRTTPLRAAVDSPKYSQSGRSTRQPVSARRLAATLWEMHEMPSPKVSESNLEVVMNQHQKKKGGSKMFLKKEKMQSGWGLHSSLPRHLSDPSHSPTVSVSEKIDQSGASSRHRRTPSISQRLQSAEQNIGVFDSISNASYMEIETRSRPRTSTGSVTGGRNRLKDVSNALITSKELLKILNRIWAHADQPSSSMSLVSALHAELERARLQVNQLIKEQPSEKNEIKYLMKAFAEERASWKSKEQEAVEAAISSIAGELEIERKLRRRLEGLNKKLGIELAEIKSSFMKAVKELESEKRAREITEQVCSELARSIDEDRAEVEKLKRESVKVHEEVEKEREMLELADKLREERVHMKLSEAKHQYEEKNSAISKLRKQLEGFLGTKRDKNEERSAYLSKSNMASSQLEHDEDGELGDVIDSKDDSTAESDLHSIELNMESNNSKNYKWAHTSRVGQGSRKLPVADEIKARNSVSGQVSKRSASLQRSVSDVVECFTQGSKQNAVHGLDSDRFHELDKDSQRSSFDDGHRYKSLRGLKDHVLSRLASGGEYHSPSRQRDQSWPLRDPCGTIHERSSVVQATSSKSRMADVSGEGQSARRSKW